MPLGLLVLLLATACAANEDPARPQHRGHQLNPYARLYVATHRAFEHASELGDPKTVAQANRHYGFTGDNPVRVVSWHDRSSLSFCVVNGEDGTYYVEEQRRVLIGDGGCSHDPQRAKAFYDVDQRRWVKGAGLLRKAAGFG